MRHFQRGTVLDVHHAILPLTSRLHPNSQILLTTAMPVGNGSAAKRLSPHDMVLHSAAHLFHEGELERGFRGLVDLDALLREFGLRNDFWPGLVQRAVAMELARPLFYALRYTQKVFSTPVPVSLWAELAQAPDAPCSPLLLTFMDGLFLRALRPAHASTSDRWTPVARGFLYLRGHWLRMTPGLLIGHLVRKMLAAAKKKPVLAADRDKAPPHPSAQ